MGATAAREEDAGPAGPGRGDGGARGSAWAAGGGAGREAAVACSVDGLLQMGLAGRIWARGARLQGALAGCLLGRSGFKRRPAKAHITSF